jgi:integrase
MFRWTRQWSISFEIGNGLMNRTSFSRTPRAAGLASARFRKALGRAGITDLHFHDHTFASQWMVAGGELYALKDILGHKTIAMT